MVTQKTETKKLLKAKGEIKWLVGIVIIVRNFWIEHKQSIAAKHIG